MGFSSPSVRIQTLYDSDPTKVDEFMKLLRGETIIYIDYANIKPWSDKLKWHIDLKRLKQFFNAIESIKLARIYYGTLATDRTSIQLIKDLISWKYDVTTKPVKKMYLSVDAHAVSDISPDLVKDFVRSPLLSLLTVDEIKYFNGIFYRLNTQGIYRIEDMKCNFDVEIGRDMLSDFRDTNTETFILFGGDSDFESPVRQLLKDRKNVILVATARRISRELEDLKKEGLIIFEIKKLKEFICWPKEDGI